MGEASRKVSKESVQHVKQTPSLCLIMRKNGRLSGGAETEAVDERDNGGKGYRKEGEKIAHRKTLMYVHRGGHSFRQGHLPPKKYRQGENRHEQKENEKGRW